MGVSPSGPEDPDTGTCVVLKKIFARKASGHSQRGSITLDAMHWQVIRPLTQSAVVYPEHALKCLVVNGLCRSIGSSAHRLIGSGRKLLRLA